MCMSSIEANRPIESPTPPATPKARSRTDRWCIASIIALTLGYYFWTTVCSFNVLPGLLPRGDHEYDHYNLLSRGFLSGHLYLDAEPPAALREAANPYDPKSRGPVEVLHDASYFRGKYYIYFGPAPVVTLFLPFTVLTGRDLPIPYGVFVFVVGY